MDLTALTQLTGANTASAGASIPADSRSLLTEISASTQISDADKSGLIAAVAQIDSGLSGAVRTQALSQVEGLGIYLRSTGSDGYPRWPMMTALRAYGLNLSPGAANSNTATVVSNLRSHLEQIAQGHSVSLSKATAAATTLGQEAVAATHAARVVAATPPPPPVKVAAPAPAPQPEEVATKLVDTLA